LKGTDEETLKNLQKAPADEFGIKHVNLMYNQDEDRFFVLLKHPTKMQYKNTIANMALNANG
jgi:hypothetical protein